MRHVEGAAAEDISGCLVLVAGRPSAPKHVDIEGVPAFFHDALSPPRPASAFLDLGHLIAHLFDDDDGSCW